MADPDPFAGVVFLLGEYDDPATTVEEVVPKFGEPSFIFDGTGDYYYITDDPAAWRFECFLT